MQIRARVPTAPASDAGLRRTSSELPADLLQQAARRLGTISLVYATTYLVSFTVGHLLMVMAGMRHPGHQFRYLVTITAASIVLSLGMFALTRRRGMAPAQLLRLGLVYEFLGALGISAGWWGAVPSDASFMGLSWVCVWILVFTLVVPATPRQSLVAALAAASTDPLVMVLSWAFHAPSVPPGAAALSLAQMFYPNYICAGLVYFCACIVHGLGSAVREARDLGSYRLVEVLGRGGMGEVWRARHRMLARPAAIKLLRPEIVGAGDVAAAHRAWQRFEREAQATADLRSPHTVELYDFGRTDDGTFYYVMELLDGVDLETLVQRFGPAPPGRTVHILLQACESLAEAHHAGMVHRDIKPANLYLCRLGLQFDFVKVLDFGIVTSARDTPAGEPQLTQEGSVSGTPAYMSPEIALGEGPIDGRADLYGLGCVAYWLLTGTTVFESGGSMKVLVDHVRTPPVPPSQRVAHAIPSDLESIVMACLEKEPANRPQSANELATKLAACASHGTWTAEDAASWWGANLVARHSTDDSPVHPAADAALRTLAPGAMHSRREGPGARA